MKYSTRFNPTVNGYLHLGHLMTVLVNQAEARASGGKFGLRFDDDQRFWHWKCGDQLEYYKDQMISDLTWFGVVPDYVHSQMEMAEEARVLLEFYFEYDIPNQAFLHERASELIGSDIVFYPLVEGITAEKVAFDFIDQVDWCIRGMDLITEDCLYRYFCERFTIATPRMTYIPRLLFEGDEVSKTAGNCKLKDLRNIEPEEVIQSLAVDCLKSPSDGWRVDNIKSKPVLGAWAYAVHP